MSVVQTFCNQPTRKMAKKMEKDPSKVITTLRFRIKDASELSRLMSLARAVNHVWNYCNETSYNAIRNHGKFLTGFDLNRLTSGSSKELGIHSTTVQAIGEEFATRRTQFKKRKLRWRTSKGSKRSLGWIPFKKEAIQIKGDRIFYLKHGYKIWLSRPIEGRVLSGSFSQDAQGRWYVNIACEVTKITPAHTAYDVGIDLGLKTSAVLSNGTAIENKAEFRKLEEKLGKAQRANKKTLVKTINAKIKNRRKDFLHKETTKIAKKYHTVFVGDVGGKFLQSGNGKSSTDASIGAIRSLLKYKAIRHSGYCFVVSENSSTVTCSNCLKKTGPSGLSGLGIREWTCGTCHAHHDRDVNAAKNILRFGRESLRATDVA
jgi:putative transposase